jgi:hypothetical protein
MIQQNDGENMDNDSLLSYMKLVDINPFTLEKNPYKDLPRNFLIYRSAYPIRLDEKFKLHIAKNSTGINVRLYNLTYGEDNANKINNNINKFKFNVWRELSYYNYIKNIIIQKKISQNFVSSILYKIDTKSDYQWTELSNTQKNKKNNDSWVNDLHKEQSKSKLNSVLNKNTNNKTVKLFYIDNESYIGNKFYNDLVLEANNNKFFNLEYIDIKKGTSFPVSKVPSIYIEYIDNSNNNQQEEYIGNHDKNDFINWVDITVFNNNKLDITISTNKTLILLTESPNSSFIKWISPIYERFGSRQNMISTGYHPLEVYKSIIFQMIYIFAVLQKECIDFDELSLENNFYIKDLEIDKNVQTYWIYNIDSIDYYVPNYGYLVLFDSKYSNIDKDDRKYKINSLKIFPNDNDDIYKCSNGVSTCTSCSSSGCTNCTYKSELSRKFNEFINPLTFANIIKTKCGINLDNDVIKLLKLIHNDINQEIYKKFIESFPEYLHNRIGTVLLKSEKELVSPLCRPKYNDAAGKLLVWEERNDFYRWVLYDSAASTSGRHKVYLFDNITNKLIEKYVFSSALYGYPSDEILSPNQISENQIIDAFVFEA